MENYIWTMIMASWTPLIIHDSYELQTSMISDHSKWGFIRFTRSMITHDCYEHWLWAITVHRNSYEFGFWTINDQTHHTWWGGINAMKCWCSYMINTDSVSYYDPYIRSSSSRGFSFQILMDVFFVLMSFFQHSENHTFWWHRNVNWNQQSPRFIGRSGRGKSFNLTIVLRFWS